MKLFYFLNTFSSTPWYSSGCRSMAFSFYWIHRNNNIPLMTILQFIDLLECINKVTSYVSFVANQTTNNKKKNPKSKNYRKPVIVVCLYMASHELSPGTIIRVMVVILKDHQVDCAQQHALYWCWGVIKSCEWDIVQRRAPQLCWYCTWYAECISLLEPQKNWNLFTCSS